MAETTPQEKPAPLPVTVHKPTPYTFDLGLLLASDPNPLLLTTTANLETELAATARDGAQALLNQLLSTCPITDTPAGVLLSLPGIETRLPREKVYLPFLIPTPPLPPQPSFQLQVSGLADAPSQPLPPPKKETTWSRFAAKKGIKPKTAETRKKLVYDEASGEWVPKWGYKGKNKEGEGDWIVEVDDKARKEGEEQRGDGRRERYVMIRREGGGWMLMCGVIGRRRLGGMRDCRGRMRVGRGEVGFCRRGNEVEVERGLVRKLS